jgi:hypothetical protein
MIFSWHSIEKIREEIDSGRLINVFKKSVADFTRKGKITFGSVLHFNFNKRGQTLKMEVYRFAKDYNLPEVSSPAMLEKRKMVNPEVFKHLNKIILTDFYSLFKNQVKTFKGYVLIAIDGSDSEVPNTPQTRKEFGIEDGKVARMKLSNCFDLLNKFVLDCEVDKNKTSERAMARKHMARIKPILGDFQTILVADMGYPSLSEFYHRIKNDDKFVMRIPSHFFKNELEKMTSSDEWVEIEYQYDRIRNYKESDPELYSYYESGKTISIRIVRVILSSGVEEILATNLPSDEFSSDDIIRLYDLRWGIETNFHTLKENMTITNISSSIKDLILQEVFSQMVMYNLIRAVQNEEDEKINHSKSKHQKKTNTNMAIGLGKDFLIHIMLEEDQIRRNKMFEELHERVQKYKEPIRKGRSYPRLANKSNKHHINKRKSF